MASHDPNVPDGSPAAADDPEGTSPEAGTAAGRGGPRGWHRAGLITGGVVAAVALGLVGVVLAFDASIDRVSVDGLGEQGDGDLTVDGDPADPDAADPPDADVVVSRDTEPITVLVLGSDTREVLTPDERRELGTGDAPGERTEVIALARIDPDRDQMRLLNVPRDSVVERCDGSRGRINAAYRLGERDGVGGISCVVQTLTSWSGLSIDHALKVDFRGFVDIVDALGGVEFHLDEPLRDRNANLDLDAGCVTLDGADALAFARARGIDDDFGRIARQQRLIAEVRAELAEAGVFRVAVRLVRTAEAVARNVELDDTLTLDRIRQLTTDYRSVLTAPIETETVPGTQVENTDAWLLQPDEAAAQELFAWLEQGAAEAEDADPSDDSETASDGSGDTSSSEDASDDASPAASGDDDTDGSNGSTDAEQPTDDQPADDAPIGSTPQRCG